MARSAVLQEFATFTEDLVASRTDERNRLQKLLEALAKGLHGRLDDEDQWLLRVQMERMERIDADIAAVEARMDAQLVPHAALRDRLMQMPGVGQSRRVSGLTGATTVAGDR